MDGWMLLTDDRPHCHVWCHKYKAMGRANHLQPVANAHCYTVHTWLKYTSYVTSFKAFFSHWRTKIRHGWTICLSFRHLWLRTCLHGACPCLNFRGRLCEWSTPHLCGVSRVRQSIPSYFRLPPRWQHTSHKPFVLVSIQFNFRSWQFPSNK